MGWIWKDVESFCRNHSTPTKFNVTALTVSDFTQKKNEQFYKKKDWFDRPVIDTDGLKK